MEAGRIQVHSSMLMTVATQPRSSRDRGGTVHERRFTNDGQVASHASVGGQDLCRRVMEGQTGGRVPSVVTKSTSCAGTVTVLVACA